MKTEPLVSICIVTYNHVNYIKECLDGILMQKTTFPFEIILGEDESDDGTREICIDYANRFPDTIQLFLRSREDVIYINGNATGRFNMVENLKAARGKYIAICEGDDYWTDPLKLQKQVDFLEKNGGYAICAHNVNELNTFTGLVAIKPGKTKLIDYNLDNYIINNKTPTCSLVFDKKYLKLDIGFPEWFCKVNFGDWAIVLMILKNSGKLCAVLPDVMGTYRIHANGIHGKLYQDSKAFRSAFKEHLRFIKTLRKELLYEKKHKLLIVKKRIKIHKRLYKLNLECKNFCMALIHQIKSMYYKLEFKLTLKNH
jgi:glycosyltransferase involved in cell wall biosynthesis